MSSNNFVREQMTDALLAFKRKHSHAAMRSLIERVAGVSAMSEIPETRYAAVVLACQQEPLPQSDNTIDPDAIWQKRNAVTGKRTGG